MRGARPSDWPSEGQQFTPQPTHYQKQNPPRASTILSALFRHHIPDNPHQLSHCMTKPDWWSDWKEKGNSCCFLVPLFCAPLFTFTHICVFIIILWSLWVGKFGFTEGLKQLQYTELHLTQWPGKQWHIFPAEAARESLCSVATTQIRSSVDIKAQLLWSIFNGTSITQG